MQPGCQDNFIGNAMPSAKQDFDLLICGTGYTGLTLAAALAKTFEGALKICLIGPAPATGHLTSENDRAFAISATSSYMLRALDIWQRLEAVSQPVRKIEITDSPLNAGIRPVLLTYDNTLENGAPACFIVPAHALGKSLFDVVESLNGITFLQDVCDDFTTSPSGVSIETRQGRHLRARLLICADGRDSTLRQKAGIDTIGCSHGQLGIVVTITHEKPHNDTAVQHFLPAGPFAALPLSGNRCCITWSEGEREARRILKMPDDEFIEEIELRFGGKRGRIALESQRQGFPLATHIARSFVSERFALVGDAAHSVHPIAGQGLNLAFRDIAALSECLIEGPRIGLDIADATLLARYQSWRRFDATLAAASFSSLNLLFSKDFTLLRSAREFGLGLVDKIPPLKSEMVREAAGATGTLPRLMTGNFP